MGGYTITSTIQSSTRKKISNNIDSNSTFSCQNGLFRVLAHCDMTIFFVSDFKAVYYIYTPVFCRRFTSQHGVKWKFKL